MNKKLALGLAGTIAIAAATSGCWKLIVHAVISFHGRDALCNVNAASARLNIASCSGVTLIWLALRWR